ncbi:MAG: hypothetical protein QM820_45995 [Minicystis sp.]
MSLALSATMGGAIATGCGPAVETIPEGSGGAGGAGGHAPSSTSTGIGPGGADGGKDALPDYVDPGCPDAGPPIQSFDCDPYHQFNGDCMPGEGCYIFVGYPEEPCGQETYGSVCQPAGFGGQGDPCNGGGDCGGGFVCVVSGSGNQCVKLCPLSGPPGCPSGLVCEPIDVEGFGGCL